MEENTNTNANATTTTNANVTTSKIATKLIGLVWNKTADGTPILCAITKDGNLHTKTTTRSYLTALDGPSGALDFVRRALENNEVEILSGSNITWERTIYAPNVPHTRNGETVVLDKEDIVDHIVKVDLQPIAEILLMRYLEHYEGTLSSLQEKLLQKAFGVEL